MKKRDKKRRREKLKRRKKKKNFPVSYCINNIFLELPDDTNNVS